jgi:hypothetical protein
MEDITTEVEAVRNARYEAGRQGFTLNKTGRKYNNYQF